jgi:tetratricopeptide (TPR) repeat protein
VGPRLKKLLYVVLGLFALLAVNAAYLGTITFSEWLSGQTYQDYFYQYMFLAHLALGLIIVVPVIVYGIIHIRNTHSRPNRRAVNVGYALFSVALLLLASGLVLTRGIPLIEIRQPLARDLAYWMHVITPLLAIWLFVLHRLAGPRINWRLGGAVGATAGVFAVAMLVLQAQDPRQWGQQGPASGEQYFFPSLARTASGNFIPAETLMMDGYCQDCHADTHEKWSHSVHRFASFNNPIYLFSVRNTRQFALDRDGDVQASRFCAGCSPRGNADNTIEEPLHYPFATSSNGFLQWVNQLLVKAKPAFHKKTFLKPLHQTPEFCGTCHKVHLAEEFNGYKWLRGQNHYDPYHLSGVSGHGITSFYYPPKAEHNCNGCHMPTHGSDDFGAKPIDGELQVHNHQFPSANTAIPYLKGLPDWVNAGHREILEDSLRVDLFGLRESGRIDGALTAPLGPEVPALIPGRSYLVELVLRTMTLGHIFTQGTADSNEIWVDITAHSDGRVVGRSGGMNAEDGAVDPWSHFVNAYVIDRDGNRIDRRNPEDIFVPLYSNQIPPGAADVVHFVLNVPPDSGDTLTVEAALQYRKFDATLMQYVQGEAFTGNDLPITTIASDSITFRIDPSGQATSTTEPSDIPEWQRWNDYGIGLLRKGGRGQLRQAEEAFAQVEALGRPEGPLNRARVYLREGRLEEAVVALERAATHEPPAYPWSVAWFTAQVNAENGYLDEAIDGYRSLVETRFQEAQAREFDFGQDYRLLNQLATTLFERAQMHRAGTPEREADLREAAEWYQRTLALDPENASAHYGLAQIWARLGDADAQQHHRQLHAKYRVDDNARDRAVRLAREKNAAADHAADAVVIYDLHRPGAFELPDQPSAGASR